MNILLLGLFFNPEEEKQLLPHSRIGLQGAVNLFQWNLIKGLCENLGGGALTAFSTLPVGVFPAKYKKLILKSKKWNYLDAKIYEIGYINLHIFKQVTRYVLFNRKIREWIKASGKNRQIIAYSLYPVFVWSLMKIKKEIPGVKITFIVGDLPAEYGIPPKNKIKAMLYKAYGDFVLNNLSFIDSFVLLTDAMKGPLKVGERPYVVVEGLAEDSAICDAGVRTGKNDKIIFYSGSLNYEFGLENLIAAFESINDPDYKLWVCGSGEAESHISGMAEKDDRIKFFGYVPKNKITELQSKATVLINPRQNKGAYTKYSFPSKTIEYLAAGKPVIMYKLDGIPSEYDEHLFYVRDDSIAALRERIIEVCSKSEEELLARGRISRKWVLKEKGSRRQAKKICDMISNL